MQEAAGVCVGCTMVSGLGLGLDTVYNVMIKTLNEASQLIEDATA